MQRNISAAICGAGNIAKSHAIVLREMGIPILLVVDINEERAKAFAEKYGVENYSTNVDDIYKTKADCVHVCTPANLHFDMVKNLLEKGYHVFCEKPLCFDNEEAKTLYRLAKENNRLHAVGFNVRFHKGVQEARKLVAGPDFGPVKLIHGTYLQEYHVFPAPYDWRYNEKLAGRMRAVTEIGSHWSDLAEFISGKRITAVSALFSNFTPTRDLMDGMMYAPGSKPGSEEVTINSENAALVHFQFEDGVVGSVVLSEASAGRVNHLSIEVTGQKQNVWWHSEENNRLNIGNKNQGVNTWVFPFSGGFRDTLRGLFATFYADIERGYADENSIYPTLYDGMRNVLICNAIYESATNSGKWISI